MKVLFQSQHRIDLNTAQGMQTHPQCK